jgi:septal ring factor EnvC (AmiA/AmiB activator)
LEEIAVQVSRNAEKVEEEMKDVRREMIELGAELTECRRAMMLMRNKMTDATRAAQDMKAAWDQERNDLLTIQVHLMEQVGNLQAVVYNLQHHQLAQIHDRDHLIIIEDSSESGLESSNDGDAEDEISLWS